MDYGAHLPLMDFGGHPYTHEHLVGYAVDRRRARLPGLTVNDHLVFSAPWLDGPMALAAVMEHTGDMTLATTVRLSVVRGPVAVAKSLGALDRLSGGRVLAGVGPGSSADDYAAAGLDFAERWPRFDESIAAIRALWRRTGSRSPASSTRRRGSTSSPDRHRPGGPPIWVGSWGSGPGLSRVARLADGWLGVGLQHDPRALRRGLAVTPGEAGGPGEGPRLVPERPGDDVVLRHRRPPGGRADPPGAGHPDRAPTRGDAPGAAPDRPGRAVRREAHRFAVPGCSACSIWPVADERRQLERFWDEVRPLVAP